MSNQNSISEVEKDLATRIEDLEIQQRNCINFINSYENLLKQVNEELEQFKTAPKVVQSLQGNCHHKD